MDKVSGYYFSAIAFGSLKKSLIDCVFLSCSIRVSSKSTLCKAIWLG